MTVDFSIIDLALANLLDLIPMISNTDENVDPALVRIYERNAAIVNGEWEILHSEKLVESCSQKAHESFLFFSSINLIFEPKMTFRT